jgi:glycosyltransferase involved in cell wall biosynthesis
MYMHTRTERRLLKILHVASHNAIQAGGSIQMERLAIGLKELGHDVTCAFNIKRRDSSPGLGTFALLHKAGIPVCSFPMQHFLRFPGMLAFRRFLARQRFDVVHAHRFRALNFVYQATRGRTLPALIGDKKNSFEIPPGWARVYGSDRVDAIVVNARLIEELFARTGRVDAAKIELIYNGVDLDRFHPQVDGSVIRAEFGVGPDTPLVGMIANFASKKSHDIFFDAAIKVLQAQPDARFMLVGGGEYQEHQQRLTAQGHGNSFIFTGFRTDVPEIIAALDVSVISSKRGEGLTGSMVEAMAMAKPVISTEIAGNAEFVQQDITGLLVPPGSSAPLAEAMLQLLRNRDKASEMGRTAYAFVKDKVDNRARSRRFADLYYGILQRKGLLSQ